MRARALPSLAEAVVLETSDNGGGAARTASQPALNFNGFTVADVGVPVEVEGFGRGILRFVGLHVHEGSERLGVELDQPRGLNDGTIRGHRYARDDLLLFVHMQSLYLCAHPHQSRERERERERENDR